MSEGFKCGRLKAFFMFSYNSLLKINQCQYLFVLGWVGWDGVEEERLEGGKKSLVSPPPLLLSQKTK